MGSRVQCCVAPPSPPLRGSRGQLRASPSPVLTLTLAQPPGARLARTRNGYGDDVGAHHQVLSASNRGRTHGSITCHSLPLRQLRVPQTRPGPQSCCIADRPVSSATGARYRHWRGRHTALPGVGCVPIGVRGDAGAPFTRQLSHLPYSMRGCVARRTRSLPSLLPLLLRRSHFCPAPLPALGRPSCSPRWKRRARAARHPHGAPRGTWPRGAWPRGTWPRGTWTSGGSNRSRSPLHRSLLRGTRAL